MLRIVSDFVDLIFENSCLICSEMCGKNFVCKKCESKFILRNENNNVKQFEKTTIYSWGMYDGKLRDGIIALKAGKKKLADYFAGKLTDFWNSLEIKNKDYIVHPVPSHKKRIKERGYCQTTLISSKFTQMTGLNFMWDFILRKKQTKFMNGLNNLSERKENIKNAFEVIKPIDFKNILLIDDILTSGSTLCEVAKTIHERFPEANILGLTVAAGDRYNI